MEGKKKEADAYMERRKKEIISSKASAIEILKSARLGSLEYNFNSLKSIEKIIEINDYPSVFAIKSKINGKLYAGKYIQYEWGNDNPFE